MPKLRRAAKPDANQEQIVKDLREAGYLVTILGLPVDIAVRKLCWPDSLFVLMEIKNPGDKLKDGSYRSRSDRKEQAEFCAINGCPYIFTSQEALDLLTERESRSIN